MMPALDGYSIIYSSSLPQQGLYIVEGSSSRGLTALLAKPSSFPTNNDLPRILMGAHTTTTTLKDSYLRPAYFEGLETGLDTQREHAAKTDKAMTSMKNMSPELVIVTYKDKDPLARDYFEIRARFPTDPTTGDELEFETNTFHLHFPNDPERNDAMQDEQMQLYMCNFPHRRIVLGFEYTAIPRV